MRASSPRTSIGSRHLANQYEAGVIDTVHLHSQDCQRLEQKRQCRLATSKTSIQEGDTGDDEPY
jgi:hypothetical protein